MKRINKIVLILFLVNVVAFNFCYANNSSVNQNTSPEASKVEQSNGSTPFSVSGSDVNTDKIEQGLENIADKGESLAYTVVEQISDKSLPVCAILILWGAVLYFILGIRNLYKKRQGLLLMWGAFTFVVIAKITNFVVLFIFMR